MSTKQAFQDVKALTGCESCQKLRCPPILLSHLVGMLQDSINTHPLETIHHHTSTQETSSFRSQPLLTGRTLERLILITILPAVRPTAGPPPVCLHSQTRDEGRCGDQATLPQSSLLISASVQFNATRRSTNFTTSTSLHPSSTGFTPSSAADRRLTEQTR